MSKSKSYTGKDIASLTDIEHVRKRTQIYLGSENKTTYSVPMFTDTGIEVKEVEFVPAVFKSVGEIIDNCLDEFADTKKRGSILDIIADPTAGLYTISDNGRGVPIDKHEKGKYTPEVVFGELRSGRNFTDGKEAGVIGQNGVGSSCVNFCSTKFEVKITRDGKTYKQTFKEGGTKNTKARLTKTASKKTGTSIKFQLDDSVFKGGIALPEELMLNRAHEIAFNNPNLTVNYNDGDTKHKFKYTKGMEDVVKKFSKRYFKFESDTMDFYVVPDVLDEEHHVFTWVNSSFLFDGGLCNTQFVNALIKKTTDQTTSLAKKAKCSVSGDDIKEGLLVLGVIKISDPEYDSQSKTRLTGPNLRKEFETLVESQWPAFARKSKQWFSEIVERAEIRFNHKAAKDAKKEVHGESTKNLEELLDATEKRRHLCRLLVTEGKSAARMITDVRNSRTDATFTLTGKINNVYGSSVAQIMNMPKIKNLLVAIGLVPGQKAVRNKLRYGHIFITTDADTDGDDIFTLLVNLFYQQWPELFDPEQDPFICRLITPNVVVSNKKKRVHYPTMAEYRKNEKKHNSWTVEYMKGLGSLTTADWEMLLDDPTKCLIPITEDGNLKEVFNLLFSSDTGARKEWLTDG